MAEVTRIINIQLTYIGEDMEFENSPEDCKGFMKEIFGSADDVLVEVKDFIKDE